MHPEAADWTGRLRAIPLFRRFSADSFDAIASEATVRSLAAGEIAFDKGAPAEHYFVVFSGNLILRVEDDDPGGVVDVVGPGACLAEDAILESGRYAATAEALTDGNVIAIPGRALRGALEDRFDLVMPLLSEMSLKLRSLVHQITDLKLRSASQRLAAHLLTLSDVSEGPAQVRLPFEKKVVAEELGMKPETLSRAIAKIQNVGVRYNRRDDAFRIANVRELREFAHGSEDDA